MVHLQPINQLYALKKQTGAALILIAFLLALLASSYMVKSLQGVTAQSKQDEKTMQALNEAKATLIAWSVSHQYSPGQMPWPDRGTDGNYDGSSDCVTTPYQNSYLLGQLPHLPTTSPCLDPNTGLNIYAGLSTYPGLGQVFTDAQGNRIWYAVSKNLVYDYETSTAPIINPGISNTSTWLKVLDRNGRLISDRVAVVLMAPGIPLANQNRSGIAGANAYLDAFEIGLASYNNHTYAITANEFVMGEDSKHVTESDMTFTKPYLFNDKLVYITIDELIYALEKRVLLETKKSLTSFHSTNNFYPFAASLGSTSNPNQCTDGNLRGLLPTNNPSNYACSCTLGRVCTCNFGVVSSIAFTRTTSTFVASGTNRPTGACSVSATDLRTCTCNGEGSCKRSTGAVQFSCNACGRCAATVNGTNRISSNGTFITATGACSNTAHLTTCTINNTSTGTFTLGACNNNQTIKSKPNIDGLLPAWFTTNEWEKYIVYAVSSDCTSSGNCSNNTSPPKIKVGINENVNAIAATSLANSNGSCSVASYLSSIENNNIVTSNGLQDNIYQKTLPKTLNNSDQLIVIP